MYKRYPLGSGPLILWGPGHLSSGIRDTYPLGFGPLILWDPGHLSSGIRDTYPLGSGTLILWDSAHLSSGIVIFWRWIQPFIEMNKKCQWHACSNLMLILIAHIREDVKKVTSKGIRAKTNLYPYIAYTLPRSFRSRTINFFFSSASLVYFITSIINSKYTITDFVYLFHYTYI